MKKQQFQFWILHSEKYLSFRSLPGYEMVQSDTKEQMWERIHGYISTGYKVG